MVRAAGAALPGTSLAMMDMMKIPRTRASVLPAVCLCLLMVFLPAHCLGQYAKVPFGDCAVYYGEGATEEDAARLGEYLFRQEGMCASQVDLHISRAGEVWQMRMPVKEDLREDEGIAQSFRFMARQVSTSLFQNETMEFIMTDRNLNTVRVLPPVRGFGREIKKGFGRMYYPEEIEELIIDRLRESLEQMGHVTDRGGIAVLTRRPDRWTLCFVSELNVLPEDLAEKARQDLEPKHAFLSKEVFGSEDLQVQVCDYDLNVLLSVGP